ncbi:MAG: hypothetical protein V3S69_04720 [Dehalococcoidales bacterium]
MTIKTCKLCDRTTKTHRVSQEGLCSTCEVALIYWTKKTPSQMMKRARQLDSFQARMEITLGNVSSLKRSRKRRRAA